MKARLSLLPAFIFHSIFFPPYARIFATFFQFVLVPRFTSSNGFQKVCDVKELVADCWLLCRAEKDCSA